MNIWMPEDRYSTENTLFNTLVVDICHYTFGQTHRYTAPRGNPNVKYGLRVIIMCEHGS